MFFYFCLWIISLTVTKIAISTDNQSRSFVVLTISMGLSVVCMLFLHWSIAFLVYLLLISSFWLFTFIQGRLQVDHKISCSRLLCFPTFPWVCSRYPTVRDWLHESYYSSISRMTSIIYSYTNSFVFRALWSGGHACHIFCNTQFGVA